MNPFIDIFRFMTAGGLVLILIILLRSKAIRDQKIPAALFTICVLGYLFADWDLMPAYDGFYFFLVLAIALPYIFWLFSESLFNDDFRLRNWMAWLLLGYLAVQFSIIFIAHRHWIADWENTLITLSILQRVLPLIFVVLGIAAALRGRAEDLITARFQFRNYFILLTASLIILTLLTEIAFQGVKTPVWLELTQKIFIAVLTFCFAGFRLLVKEYKLRNTINQQLGFRNFNDYLHSYRIKEACKLLSDLKKKDMTILEIAYEMGYSSLSPFNKAFKQLTQMTPTAWRKSKMP